MIYTITLNPSIDYYATSDNYRTGHINRTTSESMRPGGKGINVSIVLNNLGQKNKALGFVAGFSGNEIVRLLCEMEVECDFIAVKGGNSRINVKVKSETEPLVYEETDLNGMGPEISYEEINRLCGKLEVLADGDYLVLSGGKTKSMPDSVYADIISSFEGKEIKVIVDATGKLLSETLKYKPFFVKPNDDELAQLYGESILNEEDVIRLAKRMQSEGARNVLISRGEMGAVLITEEGQVLKSEAPKGKVVTTIGAGDSMVAGFIDGYIRSDDYSFALKEGICAGSASAFNENLATREETDRLMSECGMTNI